MKPKLTIIWNKGSTLELSKTNFRSISFNICIGLSSVDPESSSPICDIKYLFLEFPFGHVKLLHTLAFGRFVTKGISLWSTIAHVNVLMGVYPCHTYYVSFFNQSSMKELPKSTILLSIIIM